MGEVSQFSANTLKGDATTGSIKDIVDTCPVCNYAGKPRLIVTTTSIEANKLLWRTYQCPRHDCQTVFVSRYKYSYHSYFEHEATYPRVSVTQPFSADIKKLSSDFVEIYNQAFQAEQLGLLKICGSGY